MMKLAAVAFLCSRGLSAIDDSSVLIQQHQTDRKVDVSLADICTQKDLDNHAEKLKEFHEAEAKKKAERAEKAKAKSEAGHKAMEANVQEFLRPMLDHVEMVGKYLEAEARPGGLTIVKSFVQKLVPKSLLDNSTALDFDKTRSAFLERWEKELVVHVKSVLEEGFAALHERIEKTISEFDPVVQSHLIEATYPVHSEGELKAYIQNRILPVMLLKLIPQLDLVAKLVVTMPSDASEKQAWVQKEVLPTLLKHLPNQCQPTRLMTTLGLGIGDLNTRLGKFIEVCKKSLGVESEPAAAPPVRKCSTCEERYKKQSLDMGDHNGCMTHCVTALAGCSQGMSDTCLHQVHPCLHCHQRKLAAFDDCRGTNTHENMIEMLGDLATFAKRAPSDEKDMSTWADSFVDAIKLK